MPNLLKIYNPFDLTCIEEIPLDSENKVKKALNTAYDLHTKHSALDKFIRIDILKKFCRLLDKESDNLAKLATTEGGKPLQDSIIEVNRAINGVEIAIAALMNQSGKEIPMENTKASNGKIAFTQKEPIGVIVAISAFNHPINLIIHQIVPAIAVGCPVIVKPALKTPLSCLRLVNLLYEAGLPKEWCQVLICNDALSEKLATDTKVAHLSFIGSSKVGWHLRSKLAPGTGCTLEHGGAAPVLISPQFNITEGHIDQLVKGGYYHAGQVCVSVQRIFIHENDLNSFVKVFTKKVKALKVGNPLDKTTEVGPIITPSELERIQGWVVDAKLFGATLLSGGEKINSTCYAPTILLNPTQNLKVSTREIFGPVTSIYTYTDVDEAIEKMNALPFNFQASIYSDNIQEMISGFKKIKARTILHNNHSAFRVDWMPFGGAEQSGIGTGGIEPSMEEFTLEKLLVINTL